MRRKHLKIVLAVVTGMLLWGGGGWAYLAEDITEETIVGPGGIQVVTEKDLLMSFGATVRFIPTAENDWDFGLNEEVDGFLFIPPNFPIPPGSGLVPGFQLDDNFFEFHFNESGWVRDEYIRTEAKLYFNAMPKDRKWSFYAALEFDRPVDTEVVDDRGGRTEESSNFGLERLNISYALSETLRLHAGWDVWHIDAMSGGGLVYGDDNPGIWLKGEMDTMGFSLGFFKLEENDFQVNPTFFTGEEDDDRSLLAGYLDVKPDESQTLRLFYAFDRIRNVRAQDLLSAFTDGLLGIRGEIPDTDSHHAGAFYVGDLGLLRLFLEGVYQFGEAEDTGLARDDYDIVAYAWAVDLALELEDWAGFSVVPHLGFLYTSGDDDPADDELNGYNGVINVERFSDYWGGEYTIIGDTNLVLGSILYGYVPELYGNGTPVFTGGLPNASDLGIGRGDNPGLSMASTGITLKPREFLIFRTNANWFWWNEDFRVFNFVNPALVTAVDSGSAGIEWDNEVTLATSRHSFIKGHASLFFPDEVIEDVTAARGGESDEIASRFAIEMIISF